MRRSGVHNGLTDVKGMLVGHFTQPEAACGVTVTICLGGAVGGVDVRGAAPGTRETDLLQPVNLVERVQAVVLAGGSVYGLSAADGVVRWLAEQGSGFRLPYGHVAPIVPAAALFDLGRGTDYVPPIGPHWGYEACRAATSGPSPVGSVGAGTGAVAGGIKGGLGAASEVLDSGITIAALVAVNSFGSVISPLTGRPWELHLEIDGEFGLHGDKVVRLPDDDGQPPASNTTIGVIATDATLTKAQAQKVAQMAHDGLARAIRPAHTMFDGDTLFALATCERDLPKTEGFFGGAYGPSLNEIGRAAADCVARAIVRAVLEAESTRAFLAFKDLAAV